MSSRQKQTSRRVRRTRDALGDALIELMNERRFDTITVQEVIERAGVGRSTFYVHYSDKDDLFASDVDEFWGLMANRLLDSKDQSERIAPIRELFEHAAGMNHFLQALRSSGKYYDVFELGRLHFARAIAIRLRRLPRTMHIAPARRDGIAHAEAGAVLSLLEWWLSHGESLSASAADDLFHNRFWCGAG